MINSIWTNGGFLQKKLHTSLPIQLSLGLDFLFYGILVKSYSRRPVIILFKNKNQNNIKLLITNSFFPECNHV